MPGWKKFLYHSYTQKNKEEEGGGGGGGGGGGDLYEVVPIYPTF